MVMPKANQIRDNGVPQGRICKAKAIDVHIYSYYASQAALAQYKKILDSLVLEAGGRSPKINAAMSTLGSWIEQAG